MRENDKRDFESVKLLTGHTVTGYGDIKLLMDDSLSEPIYFHPNGRCWPFCPCDDDYHFGIRGDHFVIIEGWNELEDSIELMIVGNHKGITSISYAMTSTKRTDIKP